MNGGYKCIDFDGLDLTSESAVVIADSYKEVLNAIKTQKPICLYNITVNDAIIAPVWAVAVDNGDDSITLTIDEWSGTIDDDGKVTPE